MLTDIKIRALRGGKIRQEIPDGNGLYLIVQPSGAKSFALRFRQNGKPVKLTLGTYFAGEVRDAPEPTIDGPLTLKGARKLASDKMLEISKGSDPVAAKREANEAKRVAAENTFEAVALQYLRRECGMKIEGESKPTFNDKKRSAANSHATLVRLVFPVLGNRPIAQIRRLDVIRLLDKVEDERGPVMADRTLSVIRTIMGWHALRDEDFRSPLVRGMVRTRQSDRARDRVLSDDELRAVWKVSGEMNDPFAALIRFLLLTGARRTEASAMPWSEIKDGVWTLPRERNKIGKELVRPLSQAAKAVLDGVPKIEGCNYVFSYGRAPLTGYSKLKRKFDAAVLGELRKEDPKAEPLENWTLHDLRRTARSLMSGAEVPERHAEQCLGHIIGGVQGIYDRHKYLDEMRGAYKALAALIQRIVNPPEATGIGIGIDTTNRPL
jgi:integrase